MAGRRIDVFHNTKLHEIPIINDQGSKIFRRRCSTCASVRPTIVNPIIIIFDTTKTITITETKIGLDCHCPPQNRFVNDEGVFFPATGEPVGKTDYCDFWSSRIPNQKKKTSKKL